MIAGHANPSATTIRFQHAFKLALSIVLLYWIALSANWDMPKYGALAIALISLDTTGASVRKGMSRIVGTTAGLAVGLIGLSLFAQSGWGILIYHTSFLILVGYFMQISRYPYAWFVAGFLASLVWSTTYGKVDHAFHYATFRYLETSVGVLIYTIVCTMIWPRTSGDSLDRCGADLWDGLQVLLSQCRQRLDPDRQTCDTASSPVNVDGSLSQLLTTIPAAYADTPSIARTRQAWEVFQVNARGVVDAMQLWRQSIDDCQQVNLNRLLPDFQNSLEELEKRFARISSLWQIRFADPGRQEGDLDDSIFLNPLRLDADRNAFTELSHADRAAVLSLLQQLKLLDITSRDLLRSLRVIAGLAPNRELKSELLPLAAPRAPFWDSVRFLHGLIPAASFVFAYIFWFYLNPPTGPSIPNMAATFGLLIVMSPLDLKALIPPLLVVIWGVVAPIYFLVLPRLDSGLELLTLLFVFAFTVDYFCIGRRAGLRTLILTLFVMMTGISNSQSYSFIGLVDGGLMVVLGLTVVAIVQMLFSPVRPEQILIKSTRRFFAGCARFTSRFSSEDSTTAADDQKIRRQCLESVMLPASANIGQVQKNLDSNLYAENPPEKLQQLIDGMQSITYRLQSAEIAHRQLTRHAAELPASLFPLVRQAQRFLQSTFTGWSNLESGIDFAQQRDQLHSLSEEFVIRFAELDRSGNQNQIDDQILADLYSLMGTIRGLVDATGRMQTTISQINWSQWAAVRF